MVTRRRKSVLLYSALFVGVVWLFLFGFIVWSAVRTDIPHGLTISGWKVKVKMNDEQLMQQLDDKIAKLLSQPVLLVDPSDHAEQAELTLGQLGLQFNKQQLVVELSHMQQGTYLGRAIKKWQARKMDIPLSYMFDLAVMGEAVKATWAVLYDKQPQNAIRSITADDQVTITPGIPAERVNTELLATMLGPMIVEPLWSGQLLEATTPSNLAKDDESNNNRTPTLTLPLMSIPPEITEEILRAQGIDRKLFEFSTWFPPGEPGRTHNIRATAETIHDMILKPDEVFDYANVIRATETRAGYREAPVIVNGKIVPGVGGGICQVSTTLYNAILRAGLEVVERRNHSLPVSYIALGQDATFASDYINFRFRNNTEHHLLIRTVTTDQQVTVKLFGNTSATQTYEIESKIVSELGIPVKYVRNTTLPVGKQQVILQGKPGYIVDTYRYTKENGTVVNTEKISRDTYVAQPTVIAINSGGGNDSKGEGGLQQGDMPQKPIIEDGLRGPTFR